MSKQTLIDDTNYLSVEPYIKDKDNYPLKCDTPDKERAILNELVDRMVQYNRPISYLLSHRQEYKLMDWPSYGDFVLLLSEKDNDFAERLMAIEHQILSGEAVGKVLDGIGNKELIEIKGHQIVHKMLSDNRKLAQSSKDSEIKGGIDILKLLDQIDPTILEGVKCKLTE